MVGTWTMNPHISIGEGSAGALCVRLGFWLYAVKPIWWAECRLLDHSGNSLIYSSFRLLNLK